MSEPKILPRPAWLSLVGGLASFPLVCAPVIGLYVALGCALGGLTSGIQALRIIRSDPQTYKGTETAIAGITVSAISTLIFVSLAVVQMLKWLKVLSGI